MEKNIMCLYWIHNSMASMSVHIDIYWLVVSTPLKNISQIGSSSQLLGKIKNVPNHQPVCIMLCIRLMISGVCSNMISLDLPSTKNHQVTQSQKWLRCLYLKTKGTRVLSSGLQNWFTMVYQMFELFKRNLQETFAFAST